MRRYAVSPTLIECRTRQVRRTCEACRERKARFAYRGEVRADRHHTLCFECYRSERERLRARLLAEVTRPAAVRAWLRGQDDRPARATKVAL